MFLLWSSAVSRDIFHNATLPLAAGALAIMFCIPVAITSLPAVAADLSWYGWFFWQQLGWVTLLFSLLHVQFFVGFGG